MKVYDQDCKKKLFCLRCLNLWTGSISQGIFIYFYYVYILHVILNRNQLLLFWFSITKRLSSLRMCMVDRKQVKGTGYSIYIALIMVRQ